MELKILNIRPAKSYRGYTSDEEHYVFNLQVGQIIINEFVYRRETRAILSPLSSHGRRRSTRLVRAPGVFWLRLQNTLERALESSGFGPARIKGIHRYRPLKLELKFCSCSHDLSIHTTRGECTGCQPPRKLCKLRNVTLD